MAQPFVGQIMYTGFNFAPRGWAQCNGQILPISQNTALFSLLGTSYGGNGQSTFQLPDLRGRVPINQGQGTALSFYSLGEVGGSVNHSLLSSEMPIHTHQLVASQNKAETAAPAANSSMLGRSVAPNEVPFVYVPSNTSTVQMNVAAIGFNQGASDLTFGLIQPVLTVNANIAMSGVFPQRN